MANPELHIGRIPVSMSVAGIVEKDGNILLVKANDGYGQPAGHIEGYEFYRPDSALVWELAEETNMSPTFDMSIRGIMLSLGRNKISVGIIYKVNDYSFDEATSRPIVDDEVTRAGFFDKEG